MSEYGNLRRMTRRSSPSTTANASGFLVAAPNATSKARQIRSLDPASETRTNHGLQSIRPGPQAGRRCASMIAMQQFRLNLFPRNGAGWIGIVRLRPPPKLFALRVGQRGRLGAFDSNAVPKILDELDTLGYRQMTKVLGCAAHGKSIARTRSPADSYAKVRGLFRPRRPCSRSRLRSSRGLKPTPISARAA